MNSVSVCSNVTVFVGGQDRRAGQQPDVGWSAGGARLARPWHGSHPDDPVKAHYLSESYDAKFIRQR